MTDRLTIAVAGGVACGKSTFCRLLEEHLPPETVGRFSCDEAVRELSAQAEVASELRGLMEAFGDRRGFGGEMDRVAFRELLFDNSEFRGRVEAVLHPLVLQRLVRSSGDLPAAVRVFLVEVPLLYEAGFPFGRNLDIVVGASAARQKSRLVNERGIPAVLAEKILDSQMPIEEKAKRADIVVWNDGSLDSFGAQTEHLARRFAPFC